MDIDCREAENIARFRLACTVRLEDGTKKHIKMYLKKTTHNLFVRVGADDIHYWTEEDGPKLDVRIYIELWDDTFADNALRYLKNEQKLQQEA